MYETYRDLPPIQVTTQSTEDMPTGTWRTFRPVIDKEKCNNCYFCWKFCPDLSIVVREEGDHPSVDYVHCKGCGICANECRAGAIVMEREPL
jgi:2-oxoacid:acceptor oxidoreductase delta subunit (pyruvate/2-ketoisovalerate family)